MKFNQNPSSGNELFHVDVRTDKTDMTRPIVAFHNFAKAPKKKNEIFIITKTNDRRFGEK
jgi:hypothetical protein